jgi:uncharacterized OB-fold protein
LIQNPIANVFTWPADDPELLGGQCKDCAAVTFPVQSRCPRCGTKSMAELPLPRRGTLVSWTTQEFPPSANYRGDPTGESFEPYGVGLVQLDDLVRVESRLTECDPQRLDFGMDVVLRIVPFYIDKDGNEIITFAFAPVGAQNSQER